MERKLHTSNCQNVSLISLQLQAKKEPEKKSVYGAPILFLLLFHSHRSRRADVNNFKPALKAQPDVSSKLLLFYSNIDI